MLFQDAGCSAFPTLELLPVTVVPGGCVWSPGSEADPAEVGLAALVLAFHVVATPVLLDSGAALGTLLRVCRQPVARLTVVLALLQPLLDQDAVHLLNR